MGSDIRIPVITKLIAISGHGISCRNCFKYNIKQSLILNSSHMFMTDLKGNQVMVSKGQMSVIH